MRFFQLRVIVPGQGRFAIRERGNDGLCGCVDLAFEFERFGGDLYHFSAVFCQGIGGTGSVSRDHVRIFDIKIHDDMASGFERQLR